MFNAYKYSFSIELTSSLVFISLYKFIHEIKILTDTL